MLRYGTFAEDDVKKRAQHQLAGVRAWNNRVKSQLIAAACAEAARADGDPLRVTDLACGRGGDVPKFAQQASRARVPLLYFGADIDHSLIQVARSRESDGEWGLPVGSRCWWLSCDCFRPGALDDILRETARVGAPRLAHVVSVQMAIHYAADTREHLRAALANAAGLCAPGGVVVLSTTDAERMQEDDAGDEISADRACSIRAIFPWPDDTVGAKVHFTLGSGEGARVDDDEWLVHPDELFAAMRELGFERLCWDNFNDILYPEGNTGADPSLSVPAHADPAVVERDWFINGLYAGGIFRKTL